jgi:hypothetical protein
MGGWGCWVLGIELRALHILCKHTVTFAQAGLKLVLFILSLLSGLDYRHVTPLSFSFTCNDTLKMYLFSAYIDFFSILLYSVGNFPVSNA